MDDDPSSPSHSFGPLLTQAPPEGLLGDAIPSDFPMANDDDDDENQQSVSSMLSPSSFNKDNGDMLLGNRMSPRTQQQDDGLESSANGKVMVQINLFQDMVDEGNETLEEDSLCTQSPTKSEAPKALLAEEDEQPEETAAASTNAPGAVDTVLIFEDDIPADTGGDDNDVVAIDATEENRCVDNDEPISDTGSALSKQPEGTTLATSSRSTRVGTILTSSAATTGATGDDSDGATMNEGEEKGDANDDAQLSTRIDNPPPQQEATSNGGVNPTVSSSTTPVDAGGDDNDEIAMRESEEGYCMDDNDEHPPATTDDHDPMKTPSATDDEGSESGSGSEESSSDEEEALSLKPPLGESAYEKLRAARVAINQARMKTLGFVKPTPQAKKRGKNKRPAEDLIDEEEDEQKLGMMFDTFMGVTAGQDDLSARYPGREVQIRRLRGMFNATVAQLDAKADIEFVPPPLFIYGPGGSGKTSITRDLVQSLSSSPRVGSAYIDCATMEPSSIEALVESAYRQIARTFKVKKERRTKKKKKRSKTLKSKSPMAQIARSSQEADYDEAAEAAMEERVERARALQNQPDEKAVEYAEVSDAWPRRSSRQFTEPARVSKKSSMPDNNRDGRTKTDASSYISHGAPLAFGRSLEPFIGREGDGYAFLVLDHAERLMALAPNKTSSQHNKTNYLAQLLLLPKVMGLKLAVIVISQGSLLMNSRIDNFTTLDKASGTLDIGIHPIRVHFPAYSGNAKFKSILKTAKNLGTMTGISCSCTTDFQKLLVNSFLSALVQAMSGMTRDVRDMLYSGRRLWPLYIEPLSSENIEETMSVVSTKQEDTQKSLLSYLNQRMVKLSKNIEGSLLSLGDENGNDSTSDLPYLSKFVLLAAFLCQHNKADKDKRLFMINGNGRRRRQQQDKGEPENAAFATWDQQRLKMLKPRSFPLERLLSIFINIVGLHEGKELVLPTGATTSFFLSSLGNSVFLETLGQLRVSGLLREISSDGETSLSAAVYCCDMGKDDAEGLAASVGFSLEDYLL